ncbi:chemotaxis protein CheB [Magnetospirillum gryphiswaldense]|nr:chemotaxis protein CheB [Magnetospirillum gryphiswaldense]AVM72932.1 Chemotaxis protein methyltransferase [Magnetospirillum gryphiswaldense MSR-1]AVM76835.1 Chemotaxis protein methyltransferase [Magnetospirillum gryphiswaldense]
MKSKSTTLVAARQRRETRVLGLEFVIAIGASAGGLEALERLFNGLTGSLNCAFVVIQHLSPDHKSMMVSLLSRHTDMAVHTVEEGMPLEPGNVYLIPPAKIMTLDNGRLRLLPKDQKTLSLPIDMFFTSLAQQMGARAVAVVLSGTGSDGSRGILAINEAGGLVFVQEPQTAKFDGMPRSAIATGLVDGIYAPEEVAAQIVHHVNNPQPQIPRTRRVTKATGRSDDMLKLLQLLHHSTGVDFTEYKTNTVSRRIERRMHLRHCPDIATFTRRLDENPEEIAALKREILIPVTGFFRDQPSFSALAEEVIDKIVSAWDSNDPIRVWSAATSTGEEAYSIAILFEEAFERQRKWLPLKIFATDVEQSYIETAATGVYGDSIVAEVSPERLERHFSRKGDLYTVTKRIRQHIIFARHNVVSDPPFTKIDLILCRNMLIYLRPEVQERVLRRFQYALSPSGILFLGSSESLGSVAKDFTPLLASHKIYRVVRRAPLPLDTGAISVTEATRGRHSDMVRRRHPDTLATDAFFAGLVASYVPPSLLVNEQRELVHVVGDMTRLLLVPQGGATHDISKLLMPPLAIGSHRRCRRRARSSHPGSFAQHRRGPQRYGGSGEKHSRRFARGA